MQKFTQRGLALVAVLVSVLASVSCSPAARKARHLSRADEYLAAGNYDSAEIEYKNVLRLDSANVPAYEHLATIFFDEGRFSPAIQCLLKSKELDPNNPDVRIKLGLIYQASGKIKEAREEAKFVLDQKPQDADAPGLLANTAVTPEEIEATRQRLQQLGNSAPVQMALGTLAFRQHDLKTAAAAFQQAQALDPKSSGAVASLAQLAWLQNDLKQAGELFKTAADLAPIRSGRRLQYAQFKIETGDVAGGKEILTEIVKQTPDYLPAWTGLAGLALTETNYAECATAIDNILTREPTYYDALVLKGRLLFAQGDPVKAAAIFEKVIASYPQSATAYYQLALAQLANNETAKAMVSLNQTLALNPGLTDATLTLAVLKLNSGEFNAGIALLEPLAQMNPPNNQARQLLGDAYRGKGDLEAALKSYQQLAEAAPRNPQPPLLMGLVLLQQKKRDEARQAFTRSLAIAPAYFPAIEQLVDLDVAENQYAAAQERVEQQIKQDPQQANTHFLLAKLDLGRHDTQHAEAELLKAIELRPDFGAAYLVLANLYIQTNKHPLALEKLQIAAEKNPKDIQPLMLTAVIDSADKNYPAARAAYEKVVAINPKFYPALNDLAYLEAVQLGEVDKAYELARQARELAPNSPSTADTLGWILYLKGQTPEALGLLEESAAKLPNEPDALFHLAATQYRLGQEAAARLSFEQALHLKKPFDGQAEAQRCLAVLAVNVKTATAEDRATLEKKLAEHPDDPVIAEHLAEIYQRDGAVDKAIGSYQTVLHSNPNNARAMVNLAGIYSARPADQQQAFELAKAAYKITPDDATVSRLLGRLAYQTGDYPWALSLLQEAAHKLTGDPELLYDLAEASYSQGLVSAAEANAQQALAAGSAFSRTAEARRFLDMLALAKAPADAASAADRVQQTLAKSPDYVPALVVLALIDEQKGDASQAKQTYEKILNRYPNFSPAQKRLAILYMADPKDNQRAFEMAMKARAAYPDDPELTRALGIITYRKDDYAGAAELLNMSAAASNTDAQVMYYLGMAQYRLKQPTQSKQALQRAVALSLPGDMDGEAKRVLAELK